MPAADQLPVPDHVTVPATLDNNRLFVTLVFHRPDGSARPALAWVNMGMGGLSLAPALLHDLGPDRPVSFSLGPMAVTVDAAALLPATGDDFAQQLGPMPVEAILPAGVLRLFRVTLDYGEPSVTLAQPSDGPAGGAAVPVRMNEGTGLISADVDVAGHSYPVVIDSGAGYSWWCGVGSQRIRTGCAQPVRLAPATRQWSTKRSSSRARSSGFPPWHLARCSFSERCSPSGRDRGGRRVAVGGWPSGEPNDAGPDSARAGRSARRTSPAFA